VKKLINSPDDVLVDALAGVAAAHPELSVNVADRFITRAGGPTAGKVSLVSGGGSGHEPLHGGYVGFGMLDAACPGEVFTSPVPDQILAATKAVDAGSGDGRLLGHGDHAEPAVGRAVGRSGADPGAALGSLTTITA